MFWTRPCQLKNTNQVRSDATEAAEDKYHEGLEHSENTKQQRLN